MYLEYIMYACFLSHLLSSNHWDMVNAEICLEQIQPRILPGNP